MHSKLATTGIPDRADGHIVQVRRFGLYPHAFEGLDRIGVPSGKKQIAALLSDRLHGRASRHEVGGWHRELRPGLRLRSSARADERKYQQTGTKYLDFL